MRRFSNRNSLVTLSDINITPLLDLAFVLLIIFVITTPLLQQSLDLNLPRGGQPDRRITRQDIQWVEISRQGYYLLNGRRMSLDQIISALVRARQSNPNLVVRVAADRTEQWGVGVAVLNRCAANGIRVSIATQPER